MYLVFQNTENMSESLNIMLFYTCVPGANQWDEKDGNEKEVIF